jgi:hypothetical protein
VVHEHCTYLPCGVKIRHFPNRSTAALNKWAGLYTRIPWTERQNSRCVHGFRGPNARTIVAFTDFVNRMPGVVIASTDFLKAFRIKHFMVLEFIKGYFHKKNILDCLVPHKFVSGGNLMNGISFEMASCQVFIGS